MRADRGTYAYNLLNELKLEQHQKKQKPVIHEINSHLFNGTMPKFQISKGKEIQTNCSSGTV